jgi:hypothetical protein
MKLALKTRIIVDGVTESGCLYHDLLSNGSLLTSLKAMEQEEKVGLLSIG